VKTQDIQDLSEKNKKRKRLRNQIILLLVYVALFVFANILTGGRFFSKTNIISTLCHAVYPGLAAFGMCFIFTPGIVDLSLGAAILLSGNVGAILAVNFGLGYPGLIIGCLGSAVILEIITIEVGLQLKIPSWIAGLGMTLVYEAILALYSSHLSATVGNAYITLPENLAVFGRVPGIMIVWLVGFVACYFLYSRSSLGINIRALGCNEGVAQSMGIKKNKTILLGSIVGALFVGAAALVRLSYNGHLASISGMGSVSSIFRSLATFLLAQSFASVIGVPLGALLGALLIAALFNCLTILGVPSGTGQEIMLGAIVLLCGVLSNLKNKGVVK
jgi:ribose transport system permease protein